MNTQAPDRTKERAKALQLALSVARARPERLPGLGAIFDNTAKALGLELEKLTFLRPRLAVLGISGGSFAEHCKPAEDEINAVVRVEKWKGFICFAADRKLSMALVEAALGYDGSLGERRQPERTLTATENSIVALMFRRLCRSLADAFSSYLDVAFEISSIGNRDELGLVSDADGTVISTRIDVQYCGASGLLTIIIPQRLLEPLCDLLQTTRSGSRAEGESRADAGWVRQLSDEISRAFVRTTAVLDTNSVMLANVAAFKVGAIVPLLTTSMNRICLEIDDQPLFWCELGRQDARLALRIDEEYDVNQQQIEDV